MDGCPVTAVCLDSLAAIPALLYLNLSRCNLFDNGREKFSGLRNKVLSLGFNDISDACLIVDLATLTGACIIALGPSIAELLRRTNMPH
ncbi:hypothetical protein LOK49_LG11G02391 [Camellia lanceoleosa]|uniref:Uncharacterized protein n=1 Tax=Camellia lanceoleosa TaxID=1840588 RepID=A0ACC0FZJ9_9ERIC|nr:hypothetical protein LOK49_LG11G02391 [Camellia lanceoleosa]